MRTATDRPETALALPGGHHLIVEGAHTPRTLIHLRGPGPTQLTIEITASGPVLRFDGPILSLHAGGELAISAETVSLHARQDLQLSAGGEVRLKANDDVKLNGERVFLNC